MQDPWGSPFQFGADLPREEFVYDELNIEHIDAAIPIHIRPADDPWIGFSPQEDVHAELHIQHIHTPVKVEISRDGCTRGCAGC